MEQVNKNYIVNLNLLVVMIFHINWILPPGFSYYDEGFWLLKYPQCGGQSQSPVSIEYKDFDERNSDAMFSLINYDKKPSSVKLLNDGHTIRLEFVWHDNKPPYITGGVLGEDEFILNSINFHWSRVSGHGSEHILFENDGVMEMHLVHYNRNYGSVQNALNFIDGLSIIGALFETNPQGRQHDSANDWENFILTASQTSPAISEILSNVESVRTPGSNVDIEPFAISELRPAKLNKSPFVSYFGSLTTPPCTENVLWLLSQYPYQITGEQLQFLQETVEFDHENDHNNRPVKSMNGRLINLVWGVVGTID